MKKFYSTFLGLILSLVAITTHAADFQVDAFYFNVLSEDNATCALAAPNSGKYEGEIVVPATVEYNGKIWTVTEISNRTFYSASNLTSITLPNTVVRIRRSGIEMCNKLTVLNLSENLERLDSSAINTCNALTSIILPSKLKYIGFSGLSLAKITSLRIPASLTEIEPHAFKGSSLLASIEVDAANPAYSAGPGMLLSKNGTRVEMNLPGNKIESLDALPADVTEIAAWAFHNTASLKSVIIPDRITKIGTWSFAECRKATEFNTGNGITEIPAFAFGWASISEKLTIGDNVSSIGNNAFESYASSMYNKTNQTLVISPKMKHIGRSAFTSSGLKSIVISEGIETIDTLAFSGMYYVEKVTLPSTLKEIQTLAFQSLSKLQAIEFPASLTVIGDGAFAGCSKITNVSISENINTIGKRAFSKCGALKSIDVAETNRYFTSLDGVLFTKDRIMLKQYPVGRPDTLYIVPPYVDKLEGGAFAGSTKLTTVNIHEGVTSFGVGVFQECSALRRIKLPKYLTVLPEATFMSCTQLRNVELPEVLEEIGPQAFYMCQALPSITLPATLRTLGNNAFNMGRYWALKTVYAKGQIPAECTYDGLTTLSPFFSSTLSMGTLYVPQGCAQAYSVAPGWSGFKNIVEEVTTGIDDIDYDSDENINIYVDGTSVVVNAPQGTSVEVYSLAGICVWQGVAPASIVNLTTGIYVVRVGTTVQKLRL